MTSCVDTGYAAIYAGTNPQWVDEVIDVTLGELKKVKRDGLTPSELDRAKSQIKGNMLLGMESTDSRMNRLARNEIYFRRDVPLEELARGIESVTNDQVLELASRCFQPSQMAMVMLGDLKGRNIASDVFSALA
jgi:predicted Zn-dependent peptidase